MERIVTVATHSPDRRRAASADLDYWLSRSVQERLQALEALRQAYEQTLPHAERRLQRVCTVTRRSRR